MIFVFSLCFSPEMRLNVFLVFIIFCQLNYTKAIPVLGFYTPKCPNAERIVFDYVRRHIPNAPSLAPALLKLHFSDCFVRGCDASVLLNSTSNNKAEKEASSNENLRGFEFIDRIKERLEAECPGVVSCADILSIAARDAIGAIGGPHWRVVTGRRDGLISKASEAEAEIPRSDFDFNALMTSFSSKGLNVTDLVYLSGAHTVGYTHCTFFSNRLYNFTGYADQDPTLDACYAEKLKETKCKTPEDSKTLIEMDPGSAKSFDIGYYRNVLSKRALFQSDMALLTDSSSKSLIFNIVSAPRGDFYLDFALAMEKMGRIMIKTGDGGEIRKNCAVVNN